MFSSDSDHSGLDINLLRHLSFGQVAYIYVSLVHAQKSLVRVKVVPFTDEDEL